MSRTRIVLALFAVVLLASAFAYADNIIYNNGGPNQQNGNEMTNWIQAEDFTLDTDNTVTDVHFWTIEDPNVGGYAGSIWYGIYTDAGGAPGTLVGGGHTVAPDNRTFIQGGILGVFDEYAYDLTIDPFAATAGTTYWLALHNGPLDNNARAEVYWETTDPNGTATGQEFFLPDGSWAGNGQEHAFYLTGGQGGVPEPGTLMLMGTGVLGALAGLRRRF
jgi:hypothetical protein